MFKHAERENDAERKKKRLKKSVMNTKDDKQRRLSCGIQ